MFGGGTVSDVLYRHNICLQKHGEKKQHKDTNRQTLQVLFLSLTTQKCAGLLGCFAQVVSSWFRQ